MKLMPRETWIDRRRVILESDNWLKAIAFSAGILSLQTGADNRVSRVSIDFAA